MIIRSIIVKGIIASSFTAITAHQHHQDQHHHHQDQHHHHQYDFKCNDLLPIDTNTHLRTFEYINPKTKLRGVACASFLNNRETVLVYLEEETKTNLGGKGPRKQAVARAQKQSISAATNTANNIYNGIIHVIKNVGDNSEDLFDLDGSTFNFSVASDKDIGTFSIKSTHSADSLVYIWQPRLSVPNWHMHVDVPQSCNNPLKSFTIYDPVSRSEKDRHGIVCVFKDTHDNIKFYSLGWRKAGSSGKPQKFVNFGTLSLASANHLNVYTGQIYSFQFPPPTASQKDLKADRLLFKESQNISVVKAVNANSFMVYGDLKEVWFDSHTKYDPTNKTRHPILPKDLQQDYSADLKQVVGLPFQ